MLDLIEGRLPSSTSEVAISRSLASLPLVAMLGGLLLSRSLPPWSALRDVSAG